MQTAIVLIAHGSRRAEANDELRELARRVGEHFPAAIVAPAFLELAEPAIPEAVRLCVDGGARRIVLFPYFLSPGVHVTRDLESFRQQFAAAFPAIDFRLAPPLGAHAKVPSLVLELLSECMNDDDGALSSAPRPSAEDQSP